MFFNKKETNQEIANKYKLDSLSDIQYFIDKDVFHKTRIPIGSLLLYKIITILVKELIIMKRRLNNIQ